jgi:hypothetical protein
VVGAIEPHYYANLGKVMGLDGENLPEQNDRVAWPKISERYAQISPCECTMNGWRLPRGKMPVLHLC